MAVKKIVRQNPRKVGRPVTVAAEKSVTIRLPTVLLAAVDIWATANEASRSQAVRVLLEQALASPPERLKGKSG
jgi:metal-responsive CopG/Arc/MetJ family transcriptional regulator